MQCQIEPTAAPQRPAQTSPLVLLPQELTDVIVNNLDRISLSYLSQTCTSLREAILPVLFHDMFLDLHCYQDYVEVSRDVREAAELDIQNRKRGLTLEVLSKSPELAKLIKSLRFKLTVRSYSLFRETLDLISGPRELEMNYLLDHTKEPGPSDCIVGFHLISSLESARQSLTRLKVTYELLCDQSRYLNRCMHGHCSFKQFLTLQTLDIPLYILIGWNIMVSPNIAEVLPPNLQNFLIGEEAEEVHDHAMVWFGKSTMKFVLDFVEGRNWEKATPSLKTFSVDMGNKEMDARALSPPQAELYFKNVCEDNGLQCDRFSIPLSWWSYFYEMILLMQM